jgi:predicted  nucleic acid-binding Zn-ribbon protein
MERLTSPKAIAMVTTALFIASLLWLTNTKRINSSLETELREESLKSESLLSEKLSLEKDLEKFKEQLFSLKDKNKDLDELVKQTTTRLSNQEADYNRMKKENLSLAQLKKQRQELTALKSELENELQNLRSSYAALEAKNHALTTTVASLEERNKILSDDLDRAMFASVDQSQLHAVKRNNERLTVKAKRAKKLVASFEVPANLKNLSFRILDASGKILSSDAGLINSSILPSETNYIASSAPEIEGNRLQKVEMTYTAKEKLRSGVYTVEILNENLYVGSLKVRLK